LLQVAAVHAGLQRLGLCAQHLCRIASVRHRTTAGDYCQWYEIECGQIFNTVW